MALTHTPSAEIGSPCPDFTLPAVDGQTHSRDQYAGAPLLVMFICNHCPYVQAIEDRLIALGHEVLPKGAKILAICSNDGEKYPEDSFANLAKRWKEKEYPFPYLHDEDQSVAKSFGAVCTPDFFLFDKNLLLAYRGRLDDSWKDPDKVTSQDLKEAIHCLLEDKTPPSEQTSSMGCSIKWKSAND